MVLKPNVLIGGVFSGLVAESGVCFFDVVKDAPEAQLVATPHPTAAQVHTDWEMR